MATHHPIRKHVTPATPEIPDKLYFRIGDVARLCEVPAYVLRFWETEFPQLKPNKGGTGQRLYRKRDVEMALRIKSLLYDQGYTIPGARQVFKAEAKAREAVSFPGSTEAAPEPASAPQPVALQVPARGTAGADSDVARDKAIHALRAELRTLHAMLSRPVSAEHPPADNVKPMRPRLVVEPRPAKAPKPEPKAVPRFELHQRDLFGFDDPGPAAS